MLEFNKGSYMMHPSESNEKKSLLRASSYAALALHERVLNRATLYTCSFKTGVLELPGLIRGINKILLNISVFLAMRP